VAWTGVPLIGADPAIGPDDPVIVQRW